MSSRSSVDRTPARCSGGPGFKSYRHSEFFVGLKLALHYIIVTWIFLLTVFLNIIKRITYYYKYNITSFLSFLKMDNGSPKGLFKIYLRHCLHGRGFICNRVGFNAVTHFVYRAPVEFVIRTGSF